MALTVAAIARSPRGLQRLELDDVFAAAEDDGAHDVRPPVKRDLLTDARQAVEDEAAGCNHGAVLVRAIDAAHHQRPRSLTRAPHRSQC